MRQHDGALHLHHGRRREIGDVAAHLARLEAGRHGCLVHQRVAREVEHDDVAFHLGDRLRADHTDRVRQRGNVDGQVIAGRVDVVQVGDVVYRARHAPGSVNRHERVVAVDIHA